ncbi:symmetrical bis(5'-nucleosyl)-tetraphosphatase [Chitinimonas arctica]|uniref:Bis(5'-nucleosyl)-tetraphosphatase, symmetrical n=1 Tax=Chitinimonas arctica TaxID=2594795 RepID=A0A516SDX0_9NEIS|nr:symmetrical bis(5'-nucleosyl)-tetraphosphatase [Chitinimonas arctica]QDQ26357.1 symmetrical bis(5'-nucleosyl)-tetraphosphatase [Chitinimonas arctica]
MASYAIGDVQGCYQEFMALLHRVAFRPTSDRLYLVGDLVNRGPDSLSVLRWLYTNRHCARVVLGNHDLHLLAVHEGLAKTKGKDTLAAVLEAPDAPLLMGWLREQPLVRQEGRHVFVHAGLLPAWTVAQARSLSGEVELQLSGDSYRLFLQHMYGNVPSHWQDDLAGWDRLRLVVNACTRMRMVDEDGGLAMEFKGEPAQAPDALRPWFDASERASRDNTIVCGHWSALGLLVRDDVVALDTGCVWGGSLTAIRLEDGRIFQEPSRQARTDDWQ